MKKPSYIIILILFIAGSFLVGRWSGKNSGGARSGARKVLHYVDPMHPAYKSDKPGIAPDCGMQLEPVYAESAPKSPDASSPSLVPPGTLQISSDRQQLIGIRIGQVEETSGTRTLRTLGRIAPDETRVFRVAAAVEGWVRTAGPIVTGTIVQKDEVLATFYTATF
jgi:Cu(I)/Ag(I) efflux system membrane fusion protein